MKQLVLAVSLALIILLAMAFEYEKPHAYELVTSDGIIVTVEGRCRAFPTYVRCNGNDVYYGVVEFREVK